jgi:hypothetical protein
MIEDLDQRRDLAAQYVAELQQAQRSSRHGATPRRIVRGGAADSSLQGRSAVADHGRSPRDSAAEPQAVSARASSEMASRCRPPRGRATRVHEGTVAYAAPFSGFGTLVIVDHGGSAFTLYGHLLDASVSAGRTSAAARRSGTSACRRPAEPPCISRSASTAARLTRYNG